MKAAGVRLALDNFGTGLSAMDYVETYPFDTLKLDRAIVGEIGRSARAESIVYSVITIAHELGKSVCAVGVETERQLAFLRDEGCDLIQGPAHRRTCPEAEHGREGDVDQRPADRHHFALPGGGWADLAEERPGTIDRIMPGAAYPKTVCVLEAVNPTRAILVLSTA